ncbi:FAD:protein FMN transferase [Massilia putida]|uniref:FAD:protein FMN transferase n=1 Tax=Massilia putida TaxID=1141883 RepID=UPI0009526F03|nr:FAD:protein FMN transferase [Massilia putida]
MIRRAQPWLGTLVDIAVEGTSSQDAVTAAFAEIARLHRLMSFHDGASDIAHINRAAPGDVVRVDAATWNVLRLAGEIADLSGGAFDIACAPWLVDRQILPAPEHVQPLALTSAAVFSLDDDGQVRKCGAGWIDVGGIAKGYIVDAAVAVLEAAGVPGGCVNAGGDMRAFGVSRVPVAVRAPGAPGRAARHIMLCGEALATSGSYFSARAHRGGVVSALVDARDGRPLVSAASASVCARRCAVADALTKVVLATGDCAHPLLAAFGATAFLI